MMTPREIELKQQVDEALREYEISRAEYQKEFDAYYNELSVLFGGEIPEFISDDYIENLMYEKSPKELVDSLISFFRKLDKNDA